MNTMTDIAGQEAEPLDETIGAAEARLRALARLTEMGMSMAEMVHGQALATVEAGKAAEAGATASFAIGDFGAAFAKVARCVRLTIAQEERLEKALRDRKSGLEASRRAWALKTAEAEAARVEAEARAVLDAAAAEREAAWREANAPRLAREAAVGDVMSDVISRRSRGDWDEVIRLYDEVERLLETEGGDYEDYGQRPVSETVKRLCQKLRLFPEWNLWAKHAWAIEEAEAGVEGSPYVKPLEPNKPNGSGRPPDHPSVGAHPPPADSS